MLTISGASGQPGAGDAAGQPAGRRGGDLEELARLTYRHARRVVVLVVGGTLIVLGAALLLLPGPGLLTLLCGLGVLATEFVWARALLARVRAGAGQASRATMRALRGAK